LLRVFERIVKPGLGAGSKRGIKIIKLIDLRARDGKAWWSVPVQWMGNRHRLFGIFPLALNKVGNSVGITVDTKVRRIHRGPCQKRGQWSSEIFVSYRRVHLSVGGCHSERSEVPFS
jgi:hypothetical protein